MTYNIKNVCISPPIGSIVSYVGTSDPIGWVICDGLQRTNGSDGRYNSLIGAGIGSGTVNSTYTPPNLKGSFLRGTGTAPNGNYVGPSLNIFQSHISEAHSHTGTVSVNDPGHTHRLNAWNDDYNGVGGGFNLGFWFGDSSTQITNNISYNLTGITATLSVGTTFSSYENRPYNYGVNWIIKY